MRIFLTGATGYIGSSVLDALVRAGHDVTALVRSNEKARHVAERGGHPVVGNLGEPDSFRAAADGQDGYVHAAFDSASGRGPAIGARNNRWPVVDDRDLADLYVRLAGRDDASGIYHANDEGDERVNDIVDSIATHLTVKPDVRHVPLDEARTKMGAYAEALALD